MNGLPHRPTPARYAPDLRAMCLRDGPCGIRRCPRPERRGAPAGRLGPLAVWLRRLAWRRLRARSLYRVTGVFDGDDLP